MKIAATAPLAVLMLSLLGACDEPKSAPDDDDDEREDAGSPDDDDDIFDWPDEEDAGADDAGKPASDGGKPATADAGPESTGTAALASGGDCPEVVGPGLKHSADITGSETWTAATGPHYITSSITVKGSLTVEACAQVVLSKGVSVYVGSSTDAGRLITKGVYEEATASKAEVVKPVIFTSGAEDEYWGMLFVNGLGEAEFNSTVLVHGGDASAVSTSRGGTLVARGPNDGTLRRMVTANLLIVMESGSFGITLESGAGFKESAQASLVVLGTGRLPKPAGYNADIDPIYPVFVEPPGVGTLPEGSYFGSPEETLAENNKILVVPRNAIGVDEQFRDRGVPYLLKNTSFYMRPTTTATLTIDPGVELRFHHDPQSGNRIGMTIGDGASIDQRAVKLDIQGTAEKPIVFTSDAKTPAAGDWSGLYLDMSPSAGNKLSHARVLYAGGESGTNSYGCGPKDNDAAILVTDWRPDDAFIQNVEISASAGGGIMCGWHSDSAGPDLKSGNTFTQIANGCAVSKWQAATGLACPGRTEEAPLCL
jgi:hypothetical protein